jgi:hypothetical protein
MRFSRPDPFGDWLDRYGCRSVFVLGAGLGLGFFYYYYQQALTVAHYDAKAHLVVARGIFDSIAPGYVQLGTHWLPLTHLLYLPFVWFESQYRSGLLPSLLSVFCFALSGILACRISRHVTGSVRSGIFAGLFLLANANLQYLQSCPLTEPIYMVLLLLGMDGFLRWREERDGSLPWLPAIWAALGALCRYEGWYFLGGIILLLVLDAYNRRISRALTVRAASIFLALFALPISLHFGYLYLRTGDSFLIRVAQGNPAPFESYKRPFLSLVYHGAELVQIAGTVPLLAGLAGVIYCLARRNWLPKYIPLFLLWLPSIINLSALYWGMMYRIRYSVLLLPAIAIFAGVVAADERASRRILFFAAIAAACLPWLSWYFPSEWRYHGFYAGPGILVLPAVGAILFCLSEAQARYRWALLTLCVLAMQVPVLQGEHRPILEETLEHRFIESDRAQVLDWLSRHYDRRGILIDAQKLSPLIYDSQLPLREFIYNEGDPARWRDAIAAPGRSAGWVCVQKGDELWDLLQVDPHRLDEYSLVVHTDWLTLYQLIKIR